MQELAERGLAIVMISSELPEILGMSDRIAVMHAGTRPRRPRSRRRDAGADPGAGVGAARLGSRQAALLSAAGALSELS